MSVSVEELQVADPPEGWRAAGFAVDEDGVCWVGGVALRLVGRDVGTGVVGWTLSGVPDDVTDVDGIATTAAKPTDRGDAPDHANGVTGIDHVVVLTPYLDRTVAALAQIGLEARRHRDGDFGGSPVRQVFYRLGEVILEVVGDPDGRGSGPASIWGITFTVADLDATAAYLGDGVGRVKDAVQPGRRITTLRTRSYDITVATAFISPHVRDTSTMG